MKVLVAISYAKGVIECSQYEKLNGEFFASFVEKNFDAMFARAGKGRSRLWKRMLNCCRYRQEAQILTP